MMTVQVKKKNKQTNKRFQETLNELDAYFEKLQPTVDRIFTVGREEGYTDKEIGDCIREKMKGRYHQNTITNVFEKYPEAKQKGHEKFTKNVNFDEDENGNKKKNTVAITEPTTGTFLQPELEIQPTISPTPEPIDMSYDSKPKSKKKQVFVWTQYNPEEHYDEDYLKNLIGYYMERENEGLHELGRRANTISKLEKENAAQKLEIGRWKSSYDRERDEKEKLSLKKLDNDKLSVELAAYHEIINEDKHLRTIVQNKIQAEVKKLEDRRKSKSKPKSDNQKTAIERYAQDILDGEMLNSVFGKDGIFKNLDKPKFGVE